MATFRNYLGRLEKACFLTGSSAGWYTDAVRDASKGFRRSGRSPFKFPNFIYTRDLFRIIDGLGWDANFSKLAFVSFLFSLRVPSGALCLRRARETDQLAEFFHHLDNVTIGARICGGDPCLIIKMSWRKNLPGEAHPQEGAFSR